MNINLKAPFFQCVWIVLASSVYGKMASNIIIEANFTCTRYKLNLVIWNPLYGIMKFRVVANLFLKNLTSVAFIFFFNLQQV